jgi:hypothetical protein
VYSEATMTGLEGLALDETVLARMTEAGIEAADCLRVLAKSGGNLVGEVLRGHGEFYEWSHYPPDDIYDPVSHAQFYFHAHPPAARDEPDYGHFHTFLRPRGMPPGMAPAALDDSVMPDGDNAALSHLVAISMTREGLPVRLFTTNRWVTGETWYAAPDVIAMLDRFVIDLAYPSWPLNRWITAMVALYRPQIAKLLLDRDRCIAAWQAANPGENAFEDRRLEITSSLAISVPDQIEALISHGPNRTSWWHGASGD